MSKQQEFVDWVNLMFEHSKIEPPENAKAYFEALKSTTSEEKPAFTNNGKAILSWLQTAPAVMYKARDIAEGMFVTVKSVSGALRKLVTDGYVEKVGQNPVVYVITEKGKNVNFEGVNENDEKDS